MSTEKTIRDAGFSSTSDPYKFKKDNSTVTVRPGQGIIVDHGGRHNKYGSNTSDSFLSNRLNK
ncbi:hypothetical protein ABDD95_18650 [Mucilaginibacter sp. PAMB04274]|uniref:hypothetical protein n=1 Tax=Mucilaginibacter sp. PAMB04274 TaxID=3138568 RepID=UPI0031F65F30